jgi:hypothetical protein
MKHQLTCADLYVIHDTLYNSLRVVNYGGKFLEDVRTRTMEKIMNILAYTDLNITSEKVENVELEND